MLRPIELRIRKHTGPYPYSVDIVWPGIGNVTRSRHEFVTLKDARTYCKTEWHGIPIIYPG